MTLVDLNPDDIERISLEEWENTSYLLDLLEEKTGAQAIPVVSKDDDSDLLGFALFANGRVICTAPYSRDSDLSDCVDVLGYLFFYVFGRTEGEA